MTDESYFDSDEYQREIAAGYGQRIPTFRPENVQAVLTTLGFPGVDSNSIRLATGGNIHATYLTPDLVVKLNQDHQEVSYRANKVISDHLQRTAPVVHVLAYDNFEKTDFEVLVMERAAGTLLQDDIFAMNPGEQQELFEQILAVVKQLAQMTFENFGPVNEPDRSFPTYGAYLIDGFQKHIATIRRDHLADEADLARI